jgi:hypothetical protein
VNRAHCCNNAMKDASERHGRAQKVFLAYAEAYRTSKKTVVVGWIRRDVEGSDRGKFGGF